MTRHKDIAGRKFGRWAVLKRDGRNKFRQALWLCRCDCGATGHISTGALTSGNSRSCSCLQRDAVTSHGLSHLPEYRSWSGMTARCTRPSSNRFDSYAGRGITICARWQDFESFLADMGPSPSPEHSIERIDNDGDYEPGNCRWATAKEQARNRRDTRLVNWRGKTLCLAECAEALGVNYKALWKSAKRHNWNIESALAGLAA